MLSKLDRSAGTPRNVVKPHRIGILTSRSADATRAFLREGYEADVGHSEEALDLAAKYATKLRIVDDVQATFMRSIDAFDRYLMARLERGRQFENY